MDRAGDDLLWKMKLLVPKWEALDSSKGSGLHCSWALRSPKGMSWARCELRSEEKGAHPHPPRLLEFSLLSALLRKCPFPFSHSPAGSRPQLPSTDSTGVSSPPDKWMGARRGLGGTRVFCALEVRKGWEALLQLAVNWFESGGSWQPS